jgi:hypothetical protein
MTLDAIVTDDYVKALRVADRERFRRRLTDVLQDQRQHVLNGRAMLRFGQSHVMKLACDILSRSKKPGLRPGCSQANS